MNPRILLALACTAALSIGLWAWLHVGSGGKKTLDVDLSPQAEMSAQQTDELSVPPAAPAVVEARSPVGHSEAPRWIEGGGKAAQPWAARQIGGFVTSSVDKKPIALAVISATPPSQDLNGSFPIEARTDGLGHYEIKGPIAGRWRLICSARGYVSVERAVEVSGDGIVSADFVLAPMMPKSVLLVRLRSPDGRPFLETVQGADLEAARVLRPLFVAKCPPRAANLPAGTSVLPIRAEGVKNARSDEWFEVTLASKERACCCLMLGDRVLDAVPFDESTPDVVLVAAVDDLQRASGSIRLAVVDDVTGMPMQGVVVYARPELGTPRRAETDVQGNAVLDHMLEGDAVVEVFANERAPASRKATIRAGQAVNLGIIRVVANVSISGWADPNEGATRSWNLSAFAIEEGKPLPRNAASTAKLEASGAFTFPRMPPGTYMVTSTTQPPPSIEAVQQRKIRGWAWVDARFANVTGVRVP